MEEQERPILQTKTVSIHVLYDNYAAMLLGYINEVVKDKAVAEDYLQKTFTSIAQKINYTNWDGGNTWVQLLGYARAELTPFHDELKRCELAAGVSLNRSTAHRFPDNMTAEQKHVFCSIYYNKKSTSELSKEINKSEEQIKILLKEAFCIIKSLNEN